MPVKVRIESNEAATGFAVCRASDKSPGRATAGGRHFARAGGAQAGIQLPGTRNPLHKRAGIVFRGPQSQRQKNLGGLPHRVARRSRCGTINDFKDRLRKNSVCHGCLTEKLGESDTIMESRGYEFPRAGAAWDSRRKSFHLRLGPTDMSSSLRS